MPKGSAYLVHPFESQTTWIGHSTIIHEIYQQLDQRLPNVIICSVGGGGLLCGIRSIKKIGILTGLLSFNLNDNEKPIVVCVETKGANSFAEAVRLNKLVTIPAITSIAKSLGAKTVSIGTLELRKRYGESFVRPMLVEDSDALDGVIQFANRYRQLVEPACGASLGALDKQLLKSIVPELNENSVVLVEVCGGFGVTLDLIEKWKAQVN